MTFFSSEIDEYSILLETEHCIWESRNFHSLTIVFPAYNDERTIGELVLASQKLCRRYLTDFEIIVINDGSTDGTKECLDSLLSEVPELQVIHHSKNMGYGAAVSRGLKESSKEAVFYTDGDGQYRVEELTLLVPHFLQGINLVNGYKNNRADRWHRRCLGTIYRWGICVFFGLPIRDPDCDFRLLRGSTLKQIELSCTSGAFCVELVKSISGMGKDKIVEVGVNHFPRKYGRSQFFCFRAIDETLRALPKLWWKFTVMPRLYSLNQLLKGHKLKSPGETTVTTFLFSLYLYAS